MSTRIRTIVISVIVLLLIIALAFGIYHLVMYQKVAKDLPEKGARIVFVEQGFPHTFVSNESSIAFAPPEKRDDGILIFDELESPVDSSAKVVLAQVPGIKGMVVGQVSEDGTFTALLSGESNKADLLVTPDGIAVVAASKVVAPSADAPVERSNPEEPKEEPAENGVEETGSADGPNPEFDFGLQPDTRREFTTHLLKVDLKTGAVGSLGLGRAPRLLDDGTLLALAPEGVVQVRVDDGARTLLFERMDAHGPRSSISPDASVIALESSVVEGAGTTVDFFRYSGSPKNEIVHIGMLSADRIASSLAFLDEERFFVRTGVDIVRLYHVPQGETALALPIAVMGMTTPD